MLRYLCRFAIFVCVVAALAHGVARTWQRWGDPIVDSGRELDTPKQILSGKMLYKDIRCWYGPVAPYTNAALYRCFGVRISTLTTAGIATAVLLAWLVYRTVRLFTGRPGAAAAAIAFVYVNAFSQYYMANIFTFALPYAFSATYGILLAAASVYFLLRHAKRGRPRDFLLSCLFLSLTALCKLEVLFAAGVTHAVFIVAWLGARRLNRLVYLVGYLGAAAIPVCVYAYFYRHVGSELWWDNLFLPGNVAASWYTLEHGGLTDPVQSLRQVSISAAAMAGCGVALWLCVFAERRVRHDPTYDASMRTMAIGALGLAGGLACGGICYLLGPFEAFRSLPFLLVICFLVSAARWMFVAKERTAQVPWMVLLAFGLAASARMFLKCGAEHYGFYLLVPGLMGFAVLWCRLLPDWFTGHDGAPGASAPATTTAPLLASAYICGIAMLGATAWSHAVTTRQTMDLSYEPGNVTRIATAQGTMICPTMYKGSVDEAVRFLEGKAPAAKVVVIPEGSGITFLAGCTNPLGAHTFLPIDFSGEYGEAAMIRRLTEADPDFIVRVPRDVSEYGKKAFGEDYGKGLVDWVQDHYKPVKQYRTPTFLVVVYARR